MKTIVKIVVGLILLGVIVFLGSILVEKYSYTQEFNLGNDKVDAGLNGDAAVYFEQLQIKYADDATRLKEINKNLIQCYRSLANDSRFNLIQKQAVLKRIQEIDKNALTPEEIKILGKKQ